MDTVDVAEVWAEAETLSLHANTLGYLESLNYRLSLAIYQVKNGQPVPQTRAPSGLSKAQQGGLL